MIIAAVLLRSDPMSFSSLLVMFGSLLMHFLRHGVSIAFLGAGIITPLHFCGCLPQRQSPGLQVTGARGSPSEGFGGLTQRWTVQQHNSRRLRSFRVIQDKFHPSNREQTVPSGVVAREENQLGAPRMRTAYALTLAAALAGSAMICTPAGAAEVCDKSCVGPSCRTDCVREPNATVGPDSRDKTIIEERDRKREPGVTIEKERRPERHPGADVEIDRR